MLKKNMLTGLLVTLPAALTYIVLAFVVNGVDGITNRLVQQIGCVGKRCDAPLHFPGLGFVVIFLFIFLVGLFVSNFVGTRIIAFWDFLVHKIPFVRNIYVNSKNVVSAISQADEPLFKKLVLVDFPGKGARAVGVVCCNTQGEIAHLIGNNLVNVFILSTPNITSGYLLFVPKEQITFLAMSVDEGLAMVISLGMINPLAVTGNCQLPAVL